MGLIVRNRLRERASHAYWSFRYWWFDTENGAWARAGIIGMLVLLSISQMIGAAVNLHTAATTDEPVKAYVWVVQLIIAIVAAILVYALTPKVEAPAAKQEDMPTVDDGQAVLEIHGDCWIKDEFIRAQQVIGKEPIKGEGKK